VTALSTLARMLGLPPRLAEDALHSERAAKAVLSRRSLFAAGAAMASGAAFSFPVPAKVCAWGDLRVYFNGRPIRCITGYCISTYAKEHMSEVSLLARTAPQDRSVFMHPHAYGAIMSLATLRIEHHGQAYESHGRFDRLDRSEGFVERLEGAHFLGTAFERVAS
jgi:hypothetical protein